MSSLTVVAKIVAQKGKSLKVESHLLALVEPTLNEEGCINYDLHQSVEDENIFVFHENWESELHLDAHLASEHILACQKALEDIIVSAEVHRLRKKEL